MKVLIFLSLVFLMITSCNNQKNKNVPKDIFISKWHDNNGRVAEIKNLNDGKYLLTISYKNKVKDINLKSFNDTLFVIKDQKFYEYEKNLPCNDCKLKSIEFIIDKTELRGIITFINDNGVQFTATESFYGS